MEQENSPEQYRQMALECETCGEDIWLSEETCQLQVYLDPDVYMYSFAAIQCDSEHECEASYKFISPEDISQLGYLSNTILTQRPNKDILDWLIDQHAQVYGLTLGEQQTQEIDVSSRTYEEKMLAFIEYVEPYEFSTRLYYKDVRGEL